MVYTPRGEGWRKRYTPEEKKLFENVQEELNFFLRAWAIVDNLSRACKYKKRRKARELLARLKRVEFREQWRASAHKICKELDKVLPQFEKKNRHKIKNLEKYLKIYEGKILLITTSLSHQLKARNSPTDDYWEYIVKEVNELKKNLRAVTLIDKNLVQLDLVHIGSLEVEAKKLHIKKVMPKIEGWVNDTKRLFSNLYGVIKEYNDVFNKFRSQPTELLTEGVLEKEVDYLVADYKYNLEYLINWFNYEIKKALSSFLEEDLNYNKDLRILISGAELLEIGVLEKRIKDFEILIKMANPKSNRQAKPETIVLKAIELNDRLLASITAVRILAVKIDTLFANLVKEN
ncbi:hypothetical protein KY347_01160 [Candidatus Woesearchaeota archaeon]|nr:hypothetical protein [Candidatus Woesearchaeota archaeon]